MLRFFWDLWEKLFARLYHVRSVGGSGGHGVLRWNPRRYKGADFTLADGTVVRNGDVIGEIHFDNDRVLELSRGAASEGGAALAVMRAVAEGLGDLARAVKSGEIGPEVKCFWGLSMFHRGAERLGFQVEPVRGFYRREIVGGFEKLVISVYHPEGLRRLTRGRAGLVPREIWLSRTTLEERYGGASGADAGIHMHHGRVARAGRVGRGGGATGRADARGDGEGTEPES